MAPMKLHSRVLAISEQAWKQANEVRFLDCQNRGRLAGTVLYYVPLLHVMASLLLHHNANARLETVDAASQMARTNSRFYALNAARRGLRMTSGSLLARVLILVLARAQVLGIATESAMEFETGPPSMEGTYEYYSTAHTDGSETHHLPVTLSGVAWVRRQGHVGPGPDDFAYLLRTELCAEDNTKAVSMQPPWRRGWGSPCRVAAYGMQAHQKARRRGAPFQQMETLCSGAFAKLSIENDERQPELLATASLA
ncbi:uncharacterized protein TRIVIDRAFT_64023 [Trichoderma virens Gv29-8]|uniref:Uncharacterized protein n=1 Tax=Hypocrea virens (strain Gv29-8 / FGSC 10586) TaxID=413071 RepID=G9MNT8_HYPVG|nr:uncharacterized protein TRIVIDRAFT_64023 [Trichoderma virens Gv29-8]EHK23541.1 hypothetical protein TRIVIDRAFT_64023 [Trichoderma virens Gv29-8]UKZ49837.1 hypothetical protein TrVGV298_004090 [Trichoderma virens]